MKFSYVLIKKLFPGAPKKAKLIEALNMHSFETEDAGGDVIEISLPPNRYSDAASHIGIAREAAAIFGIKFTSPIKTIINPPSNKGFIKVEVRDQNLCPRYAARYFEVDSAMSLGRGKIGKSPRWMEDALLGCGLKPINNIVDIMNYVMLETGQPLHVFDADKLATSDKKHGTKKIIVRSAKKGEKIETLDDQKFTLDSDVLVIADMNRPVAIAGIKGGKNSGITANTKRIIVEAANFAPAAIYKAAKKLKLQTDASARFGHGISPDLVQYGLDRATELILKQKAWLLDSVDCYPKRASAEIIEFDAAKYESLIGAPVDIREAAKYFEALGFIIEPSKSCQKRGALTSLRERSGPEAAKVISQKLLVRIPPWRTDISGMEDLAEEVARLVSYSKLKPKPPVVSVKPAHQDDFVTLKDRVRTALKNLCLDEVYNSSFIGDAELRGQHADLAEFFLRLSAYGQRKSALVEVENPIAEDKKYLRPSLLPLLLKNVETNSRFFSAGGGSAFGGDRIRIFEIGKAFSLLQGLRKSASSQRESAPMEKLSLGIALAEKGNHRLILELKGIVDEFLKGLGVDDFSFVPASSSQRGEPAGEVIRIEADHKVLGEIAQVDLEKKLVVALAEMDLEAVLGFTEDAKEYLPLNRFPAVLRDISLLVGQDTRIGDVVQEIQYASPKLIENVDLIDEYTPTQINADIDADKRGYKISANQQSAPRSLTFRIIFQADDRTLTDAEVNREMEKVASALKKKFKAEVR